MPSAAAARDKGPSRRPPFKNPVKCMPDSSGAIAIAPKAYADESVCDQLAVSIVPSGSIATGSSFQVQWNVIPGAAGYEVIIQHEGGTLVYTDGVGSRTVNSNDIQGSSFTVTVKVLTPEGDVLCSVSQGGGIYKPLTKAVVSVKSCRLSLKGS